MENRALKPYLLEDMRRKIILLSGPRQSGKTTLARSLSKNADYLCFDIEADRQRILSQHWNRKAELVIFDELHKMSRWKGWLKGIYDRDGVRPPILVTGSARMDIAKKMGDSLAGRHFQFQLFPFDLKELRGTASPESIFEGLMRFSGFPEPFLAGKDSFYTKWKRAHLDVILRQDLIDLESVRDIPSIETLTLLLQNRVGNPFSYQSVAEDLQRDAKTVKSWMRHLENLYVFFTLHPFHKNIAKAVKKEPKIYFFDLARVRGDEGVRFENLVALSLKKEVAFLNECLGIESELYTLRLKGGVELDFLVERKNLPPLLIEVKLSDETPSKGFRAFAKHFPKARKIQLVRNLRRPFSTPEGIEVVPALQWLTELDLSRP